MFDLQRLRLDQAPAVLAFERANRAYFARSISDRGDLFFAEFEERHRALLADQQAGRGVFHVLMDEHGNVVGRFNLYDVHDGTAEVGYRVAERVSGRGVATAAVRELVELARHQYGLHKLKAMAAEDNVASRKVLVKAGFIPVGPAQIGNRPAVAYELSLSQAADGMIPSPAGHGALGRSENPGGNPTGGDHR